MNDAGAVVWNGDKDGPNRGMLGLDAESLPAAATVPQRPRHGSFLEIVAARLRERPDGWLCHELAEAIGVDSYRVNGGLYNLRLSGRVRVEPLPQQVWTGRRWASQRYFWNGDHTS